MLALLLIPQTAHAFSLSEFCIAAVIRATTSLSQNIIRTTPSPNGKGRIYWELHPSPVTKGYGKTLLQELFPELAARIASSEMGMCSPSGDALEEARQRWNANLGERPQLLIGFYERSLLIPADRVLDRWIDEGKIPVASPLSWRYFFRDQHCVRGSQYVPQTMIRLHRSVGLAIRTALTLTSMPGELAKLASIYRNYEEWLESLVTYSSWTGDVQSRRVETVKSELTEFVERYPRSPSAEPLRNVLPFLEVPGGEVVGWYRKRIIDLGKYTFHW